MRWKYDKEWGKEELESIKEFPGEVRMVSEHKGIKNKQVLGRLELDQAQRVLGVQLPLDRNMKVEFTYRCKQIRDFSKRTYNVPICHWDELESPD